MATAKTPGIRSDIVTLADLAPTQDVKGGARRRVFGEEPIDTPRGADRAPPRPAENVRPSGNTRESSS